MTKKLSTIDQLEFYIGQERDNVTLPKVQQMVSSVPRWFTEVEMPQLWEILLPSNSKWANFLKMEHLINQNIWQVFSVLMCKTPCGKFQKYKNFTSTHH